MMKLQILLLEAQLSLNERNDRINSYTTNQPIRNRLRVKVLIQNMSTLELTSEHLSDF